MIQYMFSVWFCLYRWLLDVQVAKQFEEHYKKEYDRIHNKQKEKHSS